MQTAYLKANYPLEFAVGLLTSVSDDSDKLMKYVTEYRKSGINVLPPNVNKSQRGFSIERVDGNIDCLRFGLSAVKGIGESAADSIVKEAASSKYRDAESFVERNLYLNESVFKGLIKAGAMDDFGYSRRALLENIPDIIKFARKEQKSKDINQLTLFDFGIENTASVYHIDNEEEYPFLKLCKLEKEATGMYLSGHPASAIEDLAKKNGAIDIEEIKTEETTVKHNEHVSIFGVVLEITRKMTRNGKPMMILNVEDATGSISVFVFDKELAKYAKELQEDSLIFIKGTAREPGEDCAVILDSVCELKDEPSILWLATNDESLINIEKLALSFKNENPGIGDNLYICSKTSRKLKNLGEISVNAEVIKKAHILFGAENVKTTIKKNR